MKLHKIVALAALILLAASTAQGSWFGVYFTSDANDCDADVAIFTPVTWYILAILDGPAASVGLAGAEFSQHGTPPGWLMTWTPNPAANVSLIHADGIDVGTNIAFPTCQFGVAGVVLLYTANGFATSLVGPTCLWIEPHQFPSNPNNLDCLRLVLCTPPVFSSICVAGGTAVINGSCELPPCSVGVQPAPWTKIKALYW